jgi:hypothetical protein
MTIRLVRKFKKQSVSGLENDAFNYWVKILREILPASQNIELKHR